MIHIFSFFAMARPSFLESRRGTPLPLSFYLSITRHLFSYSVILIFLWTCLLTTPVKTVRRYAHFVVIFHLNCNVIFQVHLYKLAEGKCKRKK